MAEKGLTEEDLAKLGPAAQKQIEEQLGEKKLPTPKKKKVKKIAGLIDEKDIANLSPSAQKQIREQLEKKAASKQTLELPKTESDPDPVTDFSAKTAAKTETIPEILSKIFNFVKDKLTEKEETKKEDNISKNFNGIAEQISNTNKLLNMTLTSQKKTIDLLEKLVDKSGGNDLLSLFSGMPGWFGNIAKSLPGIAKGGFLATGIVLTGMGLLKPDEKEKPNTDGNKTEKESAPEPSAPEPSAPESPAVLGDEVDEAPPAPPPVSTPEKIISGPPGDNNPQLPPITRTPTKPNPPPIRPASYGNNPNISTISAEEIIFKAKNFSFTGDQTNDYTNKAPITTASFNRPMAIPGIGGNKPKLATVTSKSGATAQVHPNFASQFQGLVDDLEATGYKIKEMGGYADRQNVNDPSKKSMHAYGAAIDINPSDNPNGGTKTNLPKETAAIAAKNGLGWGMNWSSIKDPMHFSAAPEEGGQTTQYSGGNDGVSGQTPSPVMRDSNKPVPPSISPILNASSQADIANRAPPVPMDSNVVIPNQTEPNQQVGNIDYKIDPNEPGNVEPLDASVRYRELFGMIV